MTRPYGTAELCPPNDGPVAREELGFGRVGTDLEESIGHRIRLVEGQIEGITCVDLQLEMCDVQSAMDVGTVATSMAL